MVERMSIRMTDEDLEEWGLLMQSVDHALHRINDPDYVLGVVLKYYAKEDELFKVIDKALHLQQQKTDEVKRKNHSLREELSYIGEVIPELNTNMNSFEFLNIVRYYGMIDRLELIMADAIEWLGKHSDHTGGYWPGKIQYYVDKINKLWEERK